VENGDEQSQGAIEHSCWDALGLGEAPYPPSHPLLLLSYAELYTSHRPSGGHRSIRPCKQTDTNSTSSKPCNLYYPVKYEAG